MEDIFDATTIDELSQLASFMYNIEIIGCAMVLFELMI